MRSAVKKVTIGKKKDEAEKRTAGGHDAGGAATASCDVRVSATWLLRVLSFVIVLYDVCIVCRWSQNL